MINYEILACHGRRCMDNNIESSLHEQFTFLLQSDFRSVKFPDTCTDYCL